MKKINFLILSIFLLIFISGCDRSNLGSDDECRKNQKKSLKLRKEINTYVNSMPTIRHSLKDYIGLEYYLQVIDVVKNYEEESDRTYYLCEIEQFIDKHQKLERVKGYMFNSLKEGYNEMAIKKQE